MLYFKGIPIDKVGYCKCPHPSSITSEIDEWGYWDVCNDCHKPIEDTYGYNSEDYLEEIMSRND